MTDLARFAAARNEIEARIEAFRREAAGFKAG
jgi:hypothetical protein